MVRVTHSSSEYEQRLVGLRDWLVRGDEIVARCLLRKDHLVVTMNAVSKSLGLHNQ